MLLFVAMYFNKLIYYFNINVYINIKYIFLNIYACTHILHAFLSAL